MHPRELVQKARVIVELQQRRMPDTSHLGLHCRIGLCNRSANPPVGLRVVFWRTVGINGCWRISSIVFSRFFNFLERFEARLNLENLSDGLTSTYRIHSLTTGSSHSDPTFCLRPMARRSCVKVAASQRVTTCIVQNAEKSKAASVLSPANVAKCFSLM